MDLRLNLSNPAWRKLVIDNAREYHAKGILREFVEANGFSKDVVSFIKAELEITTI